MYRASFFEFLDVAAGEISARSPLIFCFIKFIDVVLAECVLRTASLAPGHEAIACLWFVFVFLRLLLLLLLIDSFIDSGKTLLFKEHTNLFHRVSFINEHFFIDVHG